MEAEERGPRAGGQSGLPGNPGQERDGQGDGSSGESGQQEGRTIGFHKAEMTPNSSGQV